MKLLYSILIIAPLLAASVRDVAPEKYTLDKKESLVTYKGFMLFAPQNAHTGYVNISKGELTIENGQLVGGTVDVDMSTITDEKHGSDNNLIDHLKSEDFFDVKKFPISTFTITKVAKGDNGNTNVTGNLTIKGITHEVNIPVKTEVGTGVFKASGKVTIDRSKWDVRYGSGAFFANLANDTISDDIELDLKIVARK